MYILNTGWVGLAQFATSDSFEPPYNRLEFDVYAEVGHFVDFGSLRPSIGLNYLD